MALTLLCAVNAVGMLMPAGASAQASLTGPGSVSPGQQVSFQARGLPPGDVLKVALKEIEQQGTNVATPPDGYNTVTTDPSGSASLVFQWPTHYYSCRGAGAGAPPGSCISAWEVNHPAIVIACYSNESQSGAVPGCVQAIVSVNAAAMVTTTPCPIPAAELGSLAASLPPTPATVAVPPGVSVPATAQIFVTANPGHGVLTTLGPRGFDCKATLGGDGTLGVSLTDPTNPTNAIDLAFDVSPGGALPLACPYIPAAQVAFARNGGLSYDPKLCDRPAQDRLAQLPTGSGSQLAAAVQVPARVHDPDLDSSTPTVRTGGTNSVLAVVTAQLPQGQAGATAQDVACALPPTEATTCGASLAWFLATSEVGTRPRALVARSLRS
jgi:hypothetical protein